MGFGHMKEKGSGGRIKLLFFVGGGGVGLLQRGETSSQGREGRVTLLAFKGKSSTGETCRASVRIVLGLPKGKLSLVFTGA